MVRRIVGIVVLMAVLTGGFLLWRRHNDQQALGNGDVHCDGCMTPEEHARFLKENAGETADGASDHKQKTVRQEAAEDFEDVAPAKRNTQSTTGTAPLSSTAPGPESQAPQSSPALARNRSPFSSDTLSANPQNDARFAGNGPYQWYRQGNLTWRIDTATGRSCIIYATMEEWRKSIVIRHGCGRNA